MPGPGGTAVTSTETLQSAPSARSSLSPGGEQTSDKQNPNIKRSRIWTGAAKGQKEKPGVEKYRREHVPGRSACRFRSSEKPMSGQERPHGRFPGPVKDWGGLGRGRKGDTSACDAGRAPGKGEQEGHGARRASACGEALRRSLPGSREGPEQSSVCVSGSAGPAQDSQCAGRRLRAAQGTCGLSPKAAADPRGAS